MLIDEDIILQSTPISHGLSKCAILLGLNTFLNHTTIAVKIFNQISYDCVLSLVVCIQQIIIYPHTYVMVLISLNLRPKIFSALKAMQWLAFICLTSLAKISQTIRRESCLFPNIQSRIDQKKIAEFILMKYWKYRNSMIWSFWWSSWTGFWKSMTKR